MKEFIDLLGKDGLKAAYNALSAFALYLTLALVLIFAVAYFIVKTKAKNKIGQFKSIAFGISVGYAITLTCCIAFFMIARLSVKKEIDTNFYLMFIFFVLLFVYAVSATILALVNKKAFKICNFVGLGIAVAYGAVLLFVLPTAGEDYAPLSFAGMYIFSALLIAAIALLTVFFGKDEGTASATKSVAFAGVFIAMSFALSYIKLFSLPQGGSIRIISVFSVI